MKKVLVFAFGLAMLMPAVASAQNCLQDQYGNQYVFTVDSAHKYLYGQALMAQGCSAPTWTMLGSYTTGPVGIELTASNPLGNSDPFCIQTFKLKGNYPNFAWYYDFGYGNQEATFATCLTTPTADPSSGGVRR